jgi:hypothetical protein
MWLDRISGEMHLKPKTPFVPGQWQYVGEGHVSIRDSSASRGHVIIPDADGRVNVEGVGLLKLDSRLVLDPGALQHLSLIGDRLKALSGETWLSWISEPPLIPALQDDLKESNLEKSLIKGLGNLEEVCKRPKTQLMIEEERLPVSRCKRPAVRAPIVLSARSEDWKQRTLWGVRPHKILGVVRDENFEIYENKIAVALVRHLDVALLNRIRDVRRIIDPIEKKINYQHLVGDARNYRRAARILTLWGDSTKNEGHLDFAKETLNRLKVLHRRILALKDSPLYRKIGRINVSGLQLRMTNILQDNETYRGVAELWIAWENHIHDSSPDPDIRWLLEQNAVEGLYRYAFLVVVRALDNLGYYPSAQYEDKPLTENGIWELTGPLETLRLLRQGAKIVLEQTSSGKSMEIISIPSMLEASISIGEWISCIKSNSQRRFILNITADDSRALPKESLRLRSVGNQGDNPDLMFSSIAPWDLESVERVTRALRWFIWSEYYQSYPYTMTFESGWNLPGTKPDWLKIVNNRAMLLRPPTNSKSSWDDLDLRLARFREEVTGLQSKIAETKGTRERLHFKQKLDEAQHLLVADDKVTNNLNVAFDRINRMLNCPICKTHNSPYSFEEADNLFRCKCNECDSVWGLRLCNDCGNKYAFLAFPGNEPCDDLSEIDRRYGSDILSIPLSTHSYLCPHCGLTPESDRV